MSPCNCGKRKARVAAAPAAPTVAYTLRHQDGSTSSVGSLALARSQQAPGDRIEATRIKR